MRHIHLKDYHYDNRFEKPFRHVSIGDGDIDYKTLILPLHRLRYSGSLSLEPEVNQENTLKA
ncbi:TIM barrel protein [Faecalicoccus pleomorphus]|uniref:TIM barrel protein n=1 Tax=Faecalicoccus pleomorphus TaxID=1323 RepID=UPI00321645A1